MGLIWLIPSFFGDIRVVSTGDKTCKVLVEEATPEEQKALDLLTVTAVKKKWMPEGTTFGAVTGLTAPIQAVAKVIAKALKPGKKLVSAVKFANGKLEEVTEATFKKTTTRTDTSASSAAKATTVAAPVRGCPAPAFSPAELRAREVLCAFLTPEQREDFEKHNRFITIGATTGHRYMLTSRHATDALAEYQRTLYDLDEQQPMCVHDWDVPAVEELHALNVLIQLPGHERYLRFLKE